MAHKFLLTYALSLTIACAQQAPKKNVIVTEIPEDAVEVRSDVYRRIENGKPVIYVRTVFGVTRAEQTETMRRVLEDGPPLGIRVRETATEYFFERDTPFGTPKWSKKKNSELRLDKLSPEEQEAIAYHRKLKEDLAAPAKPNPSTKPSAQAKK